MIQPSLVRSTATESDQARRPQLSATMSFWYLLGRGAESVLVRSS